jgi:hypothetical protein
MSEASVTLEGLGLAERTSSCPHAACLRRPIVYARQLIMQTLASLFVGQPLHTLLVALPFLAAHLALRFTALGGGRNPRPLLWATLAWVLYAAWEWLVQVRTPEANIRVDLMLIWPTLTLLSAWAVFRALK